MKITKTAALDALRNTFVPIYLDDGTDEGIEVKGTLSFYHLKELEKAKPELAERYFKLTTGNNKGLSDLDVVSLIYVAYVCANLTDPDLLDEDTFTILLGYDREQVRRISDRLLLAKKKKRFEKPS